MVKQVKKTINENEESKVHTLRVYIFQRPHENGLADALHLHLWNASDLGNLFSNVSSDLEEEKWKIRTRGTQREGCRFLAATFMCAA